MKNIKITLLSIIAIIAFLPSCEKYELVPLEERLQMFEWQVNSISIHVDIPDTVTTFYEVLTGFFEGSYTTGQYNDNHIMKFTETWAQIYEEETDSNGWERDSLYDVTGTYDLDGRMIEFGDEFTDLFEQEFRLPEGMMEFEAVSYRGSL